MSACGTEMEFKEQNKDLSKETWLHLLIFQSWCAWGRLGFCHSPLPNGETLKVVGCFFFFLGITGWLHRDRRKKAVTIFQTKGSQQYPLCPQHHFRNTFASTFLEHQSAGTSQNKQQIFLQQSSLEFDLVDAKRFLKYQRTIHAQGYSVWEYL